MKTRQTTEEVSSHSVEKRVERRNWRQTAPCASEKPMEDWEKDLQTSGARVQSQKRRTLVGGQETNWEIPAKM
jgi:hypothetical protein